MLHGTFTQRFGKQGKYLDGLTRTVNLPPYPLLRIDYILATRDLDVVNAYVAPWDGQSDHRAVIAEFRYATKP
jgi:endonuclease/exonuclease/phosphatase (EEP) superfamily protein YafD